MIDDLWIQILGDMPVALQWAAAIAGLIVALVILAVGRLGIEPPQPIKYGFTDELFTMFGADLMRFINRIMTPVVNIVVWLVVGPLVGYLTAVLIYVTWPWGVLFVAAVVGLVWVLDRWWHRRRGLR